MNVRLPHVIKWLEENPVDVLAIQETKLTDDKFPLAELEAAGYHVAYTGQKTYNGVALISKLPIHDIVKNNPKFEDPQQRIIAGTIDGVRVVCAYVPNGQAVGSEKFLYKMAWLNAFHDWIQEQAAQYPQLAVVGDYNIAPEDRDVHDPAAWEGMVHVSPEERAQLKRLLDIGLTDAFRMFEQADKSYSWWDYRGLGFRLNKGLRIDHLLLSDALKQRCTACAIDRVPRKWEQPSDHTPVIATFA
ncbi:exodeoxyribonuclease-3 [Duganella sp. OV458]|nr:exodeoxyribonuclease-3 [Duganella sp. OV458]SDK73837.1 exodeoxyribonuclease-3 [Duganella sp. OV510]